MHMASHSPSLFLFHVLLPLLLIHPSFNYRAAKIGHSATTNHHHFPKNSTTNHRLQKAYTALQAWKHVIYSDPLNFTSNWNGPSVCNYTGVYCAPFPNTTTETVAGIDLNHADIAGYIPEELGLLTDLALIHLNSNRFCGIIPQSLLNLTFLFEIDLSNNRFEGPFPSVVLSLPTLKYLDIRFNEFEGQVPLQLFNRNLDAIFINNNRFTSLIPQNIGTMLASVIVFANNKFTGCIPPGIAKFANTLEELLVSNTSLMGCIPNEVGYLYKLRVLDVSFNQLVGSIPYDIAGLSKLEILNLAHNKLTGALPEGICVLPSLTNLTNFACEEEGICSNLTRKGISFDDSRNCLPRRPLQRSRKECDVVLNKPVNCSQNGCGGSANSYSYAAIFNSSTLIKPSPVTIGISLVCCSVNVFFLEVWNMLISTCILPYFIVIFCVYIVNI